MPIPLILIGRNARMIANGLRPARKVIPVGGRPMLIIPRIPLAQLQHRAIPVRRQEILPQQPTPL